MGFGNQADIAVHEYIDYCADDPMSKVIVIYLEGLRPGSGLDFIRSASAAAKKKPVVILKGGRSTAGKRAASSHTGSLAGNEALYSAAFEKAGIVEVKRLDELMPVAQTLMLCPPLKSREHHRRRHRRRTHDRQHRRGRAGGLLYAALLPGG